MICRKMSTALRRILYILRVTVLKLLQCQTEADPSVRLFIYLNGRLF